MPLRHLGYVELPPHTKSGGFDHAAIHRGTTRVYVAHPANDAVDVIDGSTQCYIESVRGLDGVAGALVSDEHEVVFRVGGAIERVPSAVYRRDALPVGEEVPGPAVVTQLDSTTLVPPGTSFLRDGVGNLRIRL